MNILPQINSTGNVIATLVVLKHVYVVLLLLGLYTNHKLLEVRETTGLAERAEAMSDRQGREHQKKGAIVLGKG